MATSHDHKAALHPQLDIHVDAKTSEPTLLEDVPQHRQITVTINHISSWVNSLALPPSLLEKTVKAIMNRKKGDGAASQETGGQAAAPEAKGPTTRQILFDISGRIDPGEVLALMGPSGSGKTSLLSVLGGRSGMLAKLEGGVYYNGRPLSKRTKRRIGFVLQDDLLFESLTVFETLYFAAMLRLPSKMTRAEKLARVDSVIQALGLEKCRNTIVGGFFKRGISGGERKRLSIGHELLINPSVVMLDEPTSGLDSTTALRLVNTLRQLAQGKRAIITTIHQPSSRMFSQLDKLMLLTEGHCLYYGTATGAVTWFGKLGFPLPYGVNPADYFLDLASGDLGEGRSMEESDKARWFLVEQYEAFARRRIEAQEAEAEKLDGKTAAAGNDEGGKPGATAVIPYRATMWHGFDLNSSFMDMDQPKFEPQEERRKAELAKIRAKLHVTSSIARSLPSLYSGGDGEEAEAKHRRISPTSILEDPETDSSSSDPSTTHHHHVHYGKAARPSDGTAALSTAEPSMAPSEAAPVQEERWGATFWEQNSILMQRSFKVRRFEALGGQRFAQLIGVAVITGLFWLQKAGHGSDKAIRNTTGLLFFQMVFNGFTALFTALFTFPSEYKMLLKERASGMYRLSAYYMARTLADIPLLIAYPVLFTIIVYFMGGLRLTAGAFFFNVFALILNVLVADAWGLIIGASTMDMKTGQTIASILMLAFMLISGFFTGSVPIWIRWVKWLSFIYYSYSLLTKIEFDGMHKSDSDSFIVDPSEWKWEVLPLIAFTIFLRVVIYIILRHKTSKV